MVPDPSFYYQAYTGTLNVTVAEADLKTWFTTNDTFCPVQNFKIFMMNLGGTWDTYVRPEVNIVPNGALDEIQVKT